MGTQIPKLHFVIKFFIMCICLYLQWVMRGKSAQLFPFYPQTKKKAPNSFNPLCLSFTSQSLKCLDEKRSHVIMNTQQINSNLNETFHWYVWLKRRMLVVKIFTYYFLLPSFNSPLPHSLPLLLPFPPPLPFTGNQDFSWHDQQRDRKLTFLGLSYLLPSDPLIYSVHTN